MFAPATYELPTNGNYLQKLCFFHLQNNDLPSVAQYLSKMQAYIFKYPQNGFAEAFFRLMPHAEITHDHLFHQDTVFQYTLINDDLLSIYQKDNDSPIWQPVYHGQWYDFVNQFVTQEKEKLFYFTSLCMPTLKHIFTLKQANRLLVRLEVQAEELSKTNITHLDDIELKIQAIEQEIATIRINKT